MYRCGNISIKFNVPSPVPVPTPSPYPIIKYLILQINDHKIALNPGEHCNVSRGDILVIKDLVTEQKIGKTLKVNFKGFVGNKKYNDGEDRGYKIDTAKDLWKNYSKDKKGNSYRIEISMEQKILANFVVDIDNPSPY